MFTIPLFRYQPGSSINIGYEAGSHVWKDLYHELKKMQNEAATCIQAIRPPLGGSVSRDANFSVTLERCWASCSLFCRGVTGVDVSDEATEAMLLERL